MDYLPSNTNLLDTLSRRPEPYHQTIRAATLEEEVSNAPDRYYFYENRTKIGKLVSELKKPKVSRFGIVDEWQNLAITFQFQEPVTLFTFPIKTVSQSESTYE